MSCKCVYVLDVMCMHVFCVYIYICVFCVRIVYHIAPLCGGENIGKFAELEFWSEKFWRITYWL